MKNSQIPPLLPIPLNSRPCNHRAIAWSSDAELAIAADDSVTIYVPTFPSLDPNRPLKFDDDDEENDDMASATKQASNAAAAGLQEGGMGILPANLPENDEEDDLGDDDEVEDDDNGSDVEQTADHQLRRQQQQKKGQDGARQFSEETARVLCVSHPALHPELNLHVWEAAGKPMPLIQSAGAVNFDAMVLDEQEDEASTVPRNGKGKKKQQQPTAEELEEEEEEEEGEETKEAEPSPPGSPVIYPHPGAGTGAIGGSGSSLNHVVAIEWSPAGLGRNQRPVLGVLTGCGSLAVYGEGGPLPFGSTARPSRMLGHGKGAVRDLQSWVVLWAVGENFVLPGQERFGYGEFVKAFAWCRDLGEGKALLAYMNDLGEIVVLCIGTAFQKTADGIEKAIWNVQELARMHNECPHTRLDPLDPDYVPSGSSYCLRWGPWSKSGDNWICLLSYMDRNYIGFRRIVLKNPSWNPRGTPRFIWQSADCNGICMHLSTDAFLEFEDTVWNMNGRLICRGMIATPLLAEPFEVSLSERAYGGGIHSTDVCNTTLPSQPVHNPITGLIIHPVLETTAPPLTPLYTAIRLSATATNSHWWESNAHKPTPKWVIDIDTQVNHLGPPGKAIHEGDLNAESAADGEDGIVRDDVDPEAAADKSDGEEEQGEGEPDQEPESEEDDPDAEFDPWANEGPDVYPYRMRLWGLALSPGGGSSAVLAAPMLTQRPMRGTWAANRSRVIFGYEELRRTKFREGDEGDIDVGQESNSSSVQLGSLSTEARMWEWMYGGGPEVPNLTPRMSINHQQARDVEIMRRRARIKQIFAPIAAAQRCELCGGGKFTPVQDNNKDNDGEQQDEQRHRSKQKQQQQQQQPDGRVLDAVCPRGHRVAVCGASGLAIVAPGISRACGVCQSRCLDVAYLVDRVLHARKKEADFVAANMEKGTCARCGGKFLD
ncbi:unnamed protein product [Discula destructiva]